jgi:hypothetical protein|tara:strand:+ start:209 stop:2716 length:2508 start_codon:yes stop_codon:yes gene_type:complete
MEVTFLEAANGLALSKKHSPKNGFTAYPQVKNVNSYIEKIDIAPHGLQDFETHLRNYSAKGSCLLKGPLKRILRDESRAGKTDRIAYSNLLVLDIDGLSLSSTNQPLKYTQNDVSRIAAEILSEMPVEFNNVSYIAQASASLGLKNPKISLHIFILLTYAVPAKAIKLWLQSVNFNSDLFKSQIELSANGHSLKYPIDISVADNSKLIFIAPPTFEDPSADPFLTPQDRIVRVNGNVPSIDLAGLMSDLSPESVNQLVNNKKNELRKAKGFNAKKEKITLATVANRTEEILQNPDRMSISIADDTNPPYVRCNVNGGDSNAYYFHLEDPTYMYNFKGEPIWSIEKVDPDFYATLFEHYKDQLDKQGRANQPIVLRDYYTDTYYNGLFDPNLNQFTADYPLLPCNSSSTEGFMRSHGRAKPDFIPDARVVFDPTAKETAVNLTNVPYYVNMYRKTEYMLYPQQPKTRLTMGEINELQDICPLIYKLMRHILGGEDLELEHFTNWLAYIFQTRKKAMTAWVLQGVPGTGKGIFYTKVLRPLFGEEHVPMRALQNIEEQFNLYMRQALFLVVDEFHMASASAGTMKIADKLKNAITENTMTIRAMRSNQVEMPNFTNFIFLTNRMDAVKIEEGDRRYNIAARQEKKLEEVYPEVIENIDNLETELSKFAGVLSTYKVNTRLVRTPVSNNAKAQMQQVTMSVMEEFFAAVRKGNLEFFIDLLDMELTNVMQGQEITTAQRFVKTWIAERDYPFSIIQLEHLRIVYIVLTDDRMSQRDFMKKSERCGLQRDRRRPHNAGRNVNPVRGVVTNWQMDDIRYHEIVQKYFNEGDKKLLPAAES